MIRNALVIVFVCCAVFVFYLPAYLQMQDLNEKNRSYQKKIADLEEENQALAIEQERLKNDPDYFEKMARERLGIIKEGELIYKVVPHGSKPKESPVSVEEAGLTPKAQVDPNTAGRAAKQKSLQHKKKSSAIIPATKTKKTKTRASSAKKKTVSGSVGQSSLKD